MIRTDTLQEAQRTILLPEGPALLYITEGSTPTITILDRAVAHGLSSMPTRDLKVCRALLEYVIEELNKPRVRIDNHADR
jgi:hypothetical protein